jgi:hypothetical protein
MSRLELDKTTPVKPPIVNKKIKPRTHNITGCFIITEPKKVASHLKTLTPVGTAITIVAAVK